MKADLTRNTFHPCEAVADSAKPEWRETVRRRKQTFATGSGVVNQESIDLSRWGLGEFPWTSV